MARYRTIPKSEFAFYLVDVPTNTVMNITFKLQLRLLSPESLETRRVLTSVGFVAHELLPEDLGLSTFLEVFDVDGDGDRDLLADAGDDLIWYPNLNGQGDFGAKQILAASLYDIVRTWGSSRSVHLADLNGDELTDIVFDAHWLQNNGAGVFELKETVTSDARVTDDIVAIDFDGDSDLDLVRSGAAMFEPVEFLENVDGMGTYVLRSLNNYATGGLNLADVNADGFMDVLGFDWWSGEMSWIQVFSAEGAVDIEHKIPLEGEHVVNSPVPLDWDQDGDTDIVARTSNSENPTPDTRFVPDQLVLLTNDGSGTFERQVLLDGHVSWPYLLEDLDADGDLDLVLHEESSLVWIENNGEQFDEQLKVQIASATEEHIRATLADLDNDGNLDVVSSVDGRLTWHENRILGDANDDGAVNFEDFLLLSSNFGAIDAVWESGDFNDDREVDFSDFLMLSACFGDTRGI